MIRGYIIQESRPLHWILTFLVLAAEWGEGKMRT